MEGKDKISPGQKRCWAQMIVIQNIIRIKGHQVQNIARSKILSRTKSSQLTKIVIIKKQKRLKC